MSIGADIRSLLPHGPSMVMLDAIESWDANEIVCVATSHRNLENPLRRDGFLPACALIEYAAQAMAVHAALIAHGAARQGVLGSVRRFRAEGARLDRIPESLRVHAFLRQGDADRAVYAFSVRVSDREIASGQVAVFYSPAPLRPVTGGERSVKC